MASWPACKASIIQAEENAGQNTFIGYPLYAWNGCVDFFNVGDLIDFTACSIVIGIGVLYLKVAPILGWGLIIIGIAFFFYAFAGMMGWIGGL